MKRFLSVTLALLLVCTLIPFQGRAAQGDKLAAITFDDGPSGTYTPQLLDGLKARGAKATFFVLGQNAENNLDVLERAYAEGHELASHSWSHPDLNGLSDDAVRRQLNDTTEVLDKVCGEGSYLLRAPYGNANSRVRNIAGVPLIYWTVDPEDWNYRNAATVRDNIVDNTYDGAIILVHDIYKTSVEGALMAIDQLQEEGYEFVTVSELHRRRGVPLEDCEWHYSCRPNGTNLDEISKPSISYTTDGTTMTVTIDAESGASVYYTTDGSQPGKNSTKYTGPFDIPYGSTVKAYAAYKMNGSRSELATLNPGDMGRSAAPTLEIVDGKVVMTPSTGDSFVYYTTDGSTANEQSTRYTAPVDVAKESYIHAVTAGGYFDMSEETIVYLSKRGVLYADADPESWYFESLDRMASTGLVSGMGNNVYEPETLLTRGMLAQLLYECAGEKLEAGWSTTHSFADVDSGEWYGAAVEWAYRNKIVEGYGDNTFGPDYNITREEFCAMIDRYLAKRGHALPRDDASVNRFLDHGSISDWALSNVAAMVKAGLVEGDGEYVYPLDDATRAEVVAILCRTMDYESAHAAQTAEVEPNTETAVETEVQTADGAQAETATAESAAPAEQVPQPSLPEEIPTATGNAA